VSLQQIKNNLDKLYCDKKVNKKTILNGLNVHEHFSKPNPITLFFHFLTLTCPPIGLGIRVAIVKLPY